MKKVEIMFLSCCIIFILIINMSIEIFNIAVVRSLFLLSVTGSHSGSIEAGKLTIILTHTNNYRTQTIGVSGSTTLTQILARARRAEQNVRRGLGQSLCVTD